MLRLQPTILQLSEPFSVLSLRLKASQSFTHMTSTCERLIQTLIKRFTDAGLLVPHEMTPKARELFVFYALERSAIVQLETLGRLLNAAGQLVHRWEQIEPRIGIRRLAVAVQETTRCITGELPTQKVLIICKGGEVLEVVGLPIDSYEICDLDVFDGPDKGAAGEYFDGLSSTMKSYLKTTGWSKEFPRSRRDP